MKDGDMGVPKIGVPYWGPYNKDPTIWGTILGFPIFGNPQMGAGSLRTRSCLKPCRWTPVLGFPTLCPEQDIGSIFQPY